MDNTLEGKLLFAQNAITNALGYEQVKAFYANALASDTVLAALSQYGITAEKLTTMQEQVDEVERAFNRQLREKGEAQAATQQRDEAFEALQDWMGDFITIARIAQESEPQYLEMLGVVQPA